MAASPTEGGAIHLAITRRVKEGAEERFEEAIRSFFEAASEAEPESRVHLIRPLGTDRTYGILRSFPNAPAKDAFYASQLFRDWDAAARDWCEGEPERLELSGLEAFFPGEAPPAWKMALLTWIAVNPAVYLCAKGIPALIGTTPPLVELLLVNAGVVALLTWLLMPLLVKLAGPWLQ